MLRNEEIVMKKGMDCLYNNLDVDEVEMFISAISKSAYDYTQWRQEYFANAYKGNGTQFETFLNTAAKNDPHGVSFELE